MHRLILRVLWVVCLVASAAVAQDRVWFDDNRPFKERIDALIAEMTLEEKASQLLNDSPAIERLGIQGYNWWSEALHGVARSGKATVFPQAIGMASTFDTNLLFRIGNAISDEARAINNDLVARDGTYIQYMGLSFWSPNVNIFRDPRWGRGQETYGEDPFLSGSLGAAFIKGMQGNDPRYLKTAACAKHFSVHSGPEALRHEFNAVVSNKDLYETYLPAFKKCVDAGVEAIMGAYNRVNNYPACGSKTLLIDILRGKWGFQGHIVSDCGAIKNFYQTHKVTRSPEESAAMALKAGVDINCGKIYRYLVKAEADGLITEDDLEERLEKVLMTRFRLGLFDSAENNPYRRIPVSRINCDEHRELAYQAAAKSIVLLQNRNNVLPLKKDLPFVYIGGPFTADIRSLYGNYNGLSDDMVTLLEGIVSKTSPSTRMQYRPGSLVADPNKNPMDWFSGQAKNADATIVGLGLTILLEGEEGEAIASTDKGDNLSMQLPENQMEYLRKVSRKAKQGGKPLIAVIFSGCPLDLTEICELADAVVYAWYPGEEGGQALADIIFGDVSPSGKLPITFPRSKEDLPPYKDYSMQGRTYKYMTKDPLYPFGFGLSYASFELGAATLSQSELEDGQTVEVSVEVANKSDMKADDVLQLYVSLLDVDEIEVPQFELKTFKRISLDGGAAEEVTFTLRPEMFYYINQDGDKVPYTGSAAIFVGNASPGNRSLELGASVQGCELNIK